MPHRKKQTRTAFTLVELFTVLAVLSILAGILLPAVQQAREAARRATCVNRLKQQSLALLAFESTYGKLPPGADSESLHSWSSKILPFLEHESLYRRIEFEQHWDSALNRPSTRTSLVVYTCPSSWKDYAGSTDYSGMRGSSFNSTFHLGRNGVLFPISPRHREINLSQITDGLSHTIAIAEAVALGEETHGFWGSGLNCIGHDDGSINNIHGSRDEIASLHPGGAHVAFVDGSVHFLSQTLSLEVIGALCTRGNGETVGDY